jgi:hypothetical protein
MTKGRGRGRRNRTNRCPKCGHVRKPMQGPDTHLAHYRCEKCNPVGPVETAVRKSVQPGDRLETLSGRGRPTIAYHTPGGLALIGKRKMVGKRKTVLIPWPTFEQAPEFLHGRGWVLIGNLPSTAGAREGAKHRKASLSPSIARWLAVVLEKAGVVAIDRGRPVRIKLLAAP